MAIESLPEEEREIIRSCLRAVLEGPFIDDDEFQTRLGVDRIALKELLESWPDVDDSTDDSRDCLLINNSMNELCHGVKTTPEEWARWFGPGISREMVKRTYTNWTIAKGWPGTGVR